MCFIVGELFTPAKDKKRDTNDLILLFFIFSIEISPACRIPVTSQAIRNGMQIDQDILFLFVQSPKSPPKKTEMSSSIGNSLGG